MSNLGHIINLSDPICNTNLAAINVYKLTKQLNFHTED